MRGRGGGTVGERDTEEGKGNEKGRTGDEEREGTAIERDKEEGRGNEKGEDRR